MGPITKALCTPSFSPHSQQISCLAAAATAPGKMTRKSGSPSPRLLGWPSFIQATNHGTGNPLESNGSFFILSGSGGIPGRSAVIIILHQPVDPGAGARHERRLFL